MAIEKGLPDRKNEPKNIILFLIIMIASALFFVFLLYGEKTLEPVILMPLGMAFAIAGPIILIALFVRFKYWNELFGSSSNLERTKRMRAKIFSILGAFLIVISLLAIFFDAENYNTQNYIQYYTYFLIGMSLTIFSLYYVKKNKKPE